MIWITRGSAPGSVEDGAEEPLLQTSDKILFTNKLVLATMLPANDKSMLLGGSCSTAFFLCLTCRYHHNVLAVMQVRINGEVRDVESATNLAELLQVLRIRESGVAVEWNRQVIPKESWPTVHIKNGDAIEIIQFVGGGL